MRQEEAPFLDHLVVGAVAIPTADIEMLVEHGVKDSKDLTHKKRVELVEWFHLQARETRMEIFVNCMRA